MSDSSLTQPPGQQISARNARLTASLFNYGNVTAMIPGLLLAPYILLYHPTGTATVLLFVLMIVPPILWFGVSMVVYAMARHHPDPQVGHCTQQAAYRFYGMFGLILPVGTFFGTDWRLWIITGGVLALILIPWSLWELWRIAHMPWQATTFTEETHP